MSSPKPFVSPSFSYETLEETLDVRPKEAELFIGIPRENYLQENRVALTPEGVAVLVTNGHRVVIETKAGIGASYTDKDYSDAGAKVVPSKKQVFESDILVKSGPVCEEEMELLKPNQFIISPIHLSLMKQEILEKMMEQRITALSFENLKDGSGLPYTFK
jgi:alanine dehydrogenase